MGVTLYHTTALPRPQIFFQKSPPYAHRKSDLFFGEIWGKVPNQNSGSSCGAADSPKTPASSPKSHPRQSHCRRKITEKCPDRHGFRPKTRPGITGESPLPSGRPADNKTAPYAAYGAVLPCEMEFERWCSTQNRSPCETRGRRRGPAPDEKAHLQERCNYLAIRL